jgi:hypothetical protein
MHLTISLWLFQIMSDTCNVIVILLLQIMHQNPLYDSLIKQQQSKFISETFGLPLLIRLNIIILNSC